jgi:ABC-type multidrug transport system fused ATPase/permease subunit
LWIVATWKGGDPSAMRSSGSSPRGRAAARTAALGRLLWAAKDRASLTWFALAMALVLAGGAVATLGPWLLKRLIDLLGAPAPPAATGAALGLAGAYVAALAIQRVAEQLQAYAYGRGEQGLVRRLSASAYAHVLGLPLPTHVEQRSGAMAQALTDGMFGARLLLTHAVMTVAPAIAQLAMASVVLASVFGAQAASLVTVALLAYAVTFGLTVRAQASAARRISAAQIDAGGVAADGLMNVETLKAFTAEDRYAARYEAALGVREHEWRRFLARRLEGGLALALLFLLLLGSVMLAGAQGVAAGRFGVGSFVLLNAYVLQLVRPLEMLGFALRDLGQGLAYLEGLLALLEQAREDTGRPSRAPPGGGRGPAELVFREVGFSYAGHEPCLSALSFRIPPGRFVGVVGPSGSGKSTLLRLVLRLYDANAGEIFLDGRPIREMSIRELRDQVALVPQETILLHDTIRANIALAVQAPAGPAIAQAARVAHLEDWLARLPQGLDTPVGERGLRLSGGEKQRVSIARAALKTARLVLFDEATAALDPATERAVWRAVRAMAGNATILAVTHRLSTVAGADEILVLDRGEIVERGRHGELLARGGLYARLWRSQDAAAATGT